MESRPKRRAQGMLTEPLDDGLVVYDGSRTQAHSLDAAATTVWRLADGTRTVGEIAADAELDEPTTEATLVRLQEEGLIEEDPALSRRKLLKRTAAISAGALAVAPLIETVVIPTAAAHASGGNIPETPPGPPTPPGTPPTPPGGPPLVLEQPPVTHTTPAKKKKKKKKKHHVKLRKHHHKKPKRKRPPSFTG